MSLLAEKIKQRDKKAIGRLISDVEKGSRESIEELDGLYPLAGNAYILGVTGSPGTGKSTIISRLIRLYLGEGKKVAVVAIDPTSPFTGGAVLGDRVRMQDSVPDENLFIRSMGSREAAGGLSPRTSEVVTILDAAGYDIIIIETVGSGQDEVAVDMTADTVVVVTAPGLGDRIQAIKAGIYEIADILVVNKCDLDGALLKARQLELAAVEKNGWKTPIVITSATRPEGIDELAEKIDGHRRHILSSGEYLTRRKKRAEGHLLSLVREKLLGALIERDDISMEIERSAGDVLSGKSSPCAEADRITRGILAT
ncbi:MAG: methylmalonyl Co-A mutase-associated GTPase MeaB [Candidatus Tritonobacter lacicola]|nr:methylmalonyl Co-A mutase-associated GTPase MeaB [Candidatus Tritonobacter lacicola]